MARKKPKPKKTEETSRSGAPIWRHAERTKPFELAIGDEKSMKKLEAHLTEHLGEAKGVFHEILSDLVHVDIHVFEANEDRDHHTLVTTGMSDRPMKTPEGAEEYRFAELLIHLPADWRLEQKDFADEANYWPIRWLKLLARLPHEYDTWLADGHTIPNGDPPEPFAKNTRLCGVMLIQPMLVSEEFAVADLGHKKVHFYQVFPLYAEEMQLKLDEGAEALIERLAKADVTLLADPSRPNVAAKPRKKRS